MFSVFLPFRSFRAEAAGEFFKKKSTAQIFRNPDPYLLPASERAINLSNPAKLFRFLFTICPGRSRASPGKQKYTLRSLALPTKS
jgi:hypothetical protein